MNKDTKILIGIVVGLVMVLGGILAMDGRPTAPAQQMVGNDRDTHGCIGSAGYSWCEARQACERSWEQYCTAAEAKKVVFACKDDKSITATFYPTDDKFVDLELGEDRNISVPRAVSASGARYAKADETFVFWNKGDTAFITEGASSTVTFKDCALKAE